MPIKVLFIPLDAYGHINACSGIGQKLVQLGHNVTFALEKAWEGKLKCYGFEEAIYTDPSREAGKEPNEHWTESMELILDTLHKDSLYKAGHQNVKEFEEFVFNALKFDDQLVKIIDECKPDVIVLDHYFTVPAVIKSNIRWVHMTSATPLSSIQHPDTPPTGSGYSIDGDRNEWETFKKVSDNHYGPVSKKFLECLKEEYGLEAPPNGSLFHHSPYLNIYAYPVELDYLDKRPLPLNWMRFDHFIRLPETKTPFELPAKFKDLPEKLIYISMGSMGGYDRKLLERIISLLKDSPYKFLMVMGPNDDIELPENFYGEKFLPQLTILPMIDLFITHGGNNSIIESLYYGKPIIVNPLFADQYDNAQRVKEKRFGGRINLYTCDSKELITMIETILADRNMAVRLATISKRMRNAKSTEEAAKEIVNITEMPLRPL